MINKATGSVTTTVLVISANANNANAMT